MKEQMQSFLYAFAIMLGMLSILPVHGAERHLKYQEEVQHLLDYLGTSGCQFYRNGQWYGAQKAKEHLGKKYRYLLKKSLISTTEQFIALGATQSSVSGEPYQVRCGSGSALSSAQWLSSELKRYRERNQNER